VLKSLLETAEMEQASFGPVSIKERRKNYYSLMYFWITLNNGWAKSFNSLFQQDYFEMILKQRRVV